MDFKENRRVNKDGWDKFVDFVVDDVGGGIKSGASWTGEKFSNLSDTIEDGWDNVFNPEPVSLDDRVRKEIQRRFPKGFKGSKAEKARLYSIFIRSYGLSALKLEAELNPILSEIERLETLQTEVGGRIDSETDLMEDAQDNSDRASRVNAINLPPSQGDEIAKEVYGTDNTPAGQPLISPDKDKDWDKYKFKPKRKTSRRFYFAGKAEDEKKNANENPSAPKNTSNGTVLNTLSEIPTGNWEEYVGYIRTNWRDQLVKDGYRREDVYNVDGIKAYYDIGPNTNLSVIDETTRKKVSATQESLMRDKSFVFVVDGELFVTPFTKTVLFEEKIDDPVIIAPSTVVSRPSAATAPNTEDMYDPVSDTVQGDQDKVVEAKAANINTLKNRLIRVYITDENAIKTINKRLAGKGLKSPLSTTQQMTLETALNYLESTEDVIETDLGKYNGNLNSARIRLEKLQERSKPKE